MRHEIVWPSKNANTVTSEYSGTFHSGHTITHENSEF